MATSVDLEEINVEYINRTSDECNTSTNTGIKNDQSITIHTTPKDNSNSTTDGRGRSVNSAKYRAMENIGKLYFFIRNKIFMRVVFLADFPLIILK